MIFYLEHADVSVEHAVKLMRKEEDTIAHNFKLYQTGMLQLPPINPNLLGPMMSYNRKKFSMNFHQLINYSESAPPAPNPLSMMGNYGNLQGEAVLG